MNWFTWAHAEEFLKNPFLNIALAIILVVVGKRSGVMVEHVLLAIAWGIATISAYRAVPISLQPLIPRLLFTLLFSSVVGLCLYFILWTKPEPPILQPKTAESPRLPITNEISKSQVAESPQPPETTMPRVEPIAHGPEIKTSLKWVLGENGVDIWNPIFKIFNNGPEKVVSLDVMYYTYTVDLDNNKLVISSHTGITKVELKFMNRKELDVFEYEEKGAWNFNADFKDINAVSVNVFDIRYFAKMDEGLKYYNRKDIFFIHGSMIYTQEEYMKNKDDYNKAISYLEGVVLGNKQFIERMKHIPVFKPK